MDILWSFPERLRRRRFLRGLTQRELGARVDVSREVIRRFEDGTSRPTRRLLVRLAAALGAEVSELIHRTDWRPPEKAGRLPASRMRRRCTWRPQQQGQTASCLRTAFQRLPEQVKRLLAQVRSRSDLPLVRRFLREVSCSSWIEAYFILALLAAGARPVWEAPLRVGFRIYPVVLRKQQAGDCLHPSLELVVEGVRLLVLFQVSLQTSPAPIRVDGLVAVGLRGRKTRWLVAELDGPLHVQSRDGERQKLHDLPEVRLPEAIFGKEDVLQAFFLGVRRQLDLPNPLPESLRVDWKQRRTSDAA